MSNIYTWGDVLQASFYDIWIGVAIILGRLVSQIIKTVKLDTALRGAGFDKVVDRAGFTLNSGGFLGALVKWFFIVVALVASLQIIGLTEVTSYLSEVVLGYLPRVIVAAFILLVSVVIAQATERIIVSSAKAANVSSANILGVVGKWAVWIFAALFALSQLQILDQFINSLFIGLIGAISLALGLSFGLGGRDAAARYIEKMKSEIHSN
jgi:hypothetical protein